MSTTTPELAWRRPSRAGRVSIDRDRLKESAPLVLLLGVAGVLYLWGLSRNGWANEYYAAAVQAGTHSWKAFLFGSLDASNYITVDKPPASLWAMELSSRIFGFSSFSMLLPQALEGVAAVALLYATVRRWFGSGAAFLSGLILAITPVAALMFRFNNPDALLVLSMVLAAYATSRALEQGSTRWLALCAVAIGFAFLTKELQALVVLPPIALTYLLVAPVPLRRRIWQLAAAGAVLVLSAGWWIALVQLWPASSRPYIGDSTTNSILQVVFGSNGLDRISSGAGPGGLGFSGSAGILRLFNAQMGAQISWLLPAAVIVLAAGAIWTIRRPRTDRTRAALLLWGGWLIIAAAIYSLMTGIIHPYYTNTLAPPVAALAGTGAALLWRRRDQLAARLLLAGMLVASGIWAYVLLDRAPAWQPWLRFSILVGSGLVALAIVGWRRVRGSIRAGVASAGLVVALAAPAAFTVSTVGMSESGANPVAGPAVATDIGSGAGGAALSGRALRFARGGAGAGRSVSRSLLSLLERDSSRYTWVAATSSAQTAAPIELETGASVMAIGGFGGSDPAITLRQFERLVAERKLHYYVSGGGFGGGPGAIPGGPRAFGRGFAGEGAPPLGPGVPGGGFPGVGGVGVPGAGAGAAGPPALRFGRQHGGFGPGKRTVASQIQSWVQSHFRSETAGGVTVYDLTRAKTA